MGTEREVVTVLDEEVQLARQQTSAVAADDGARSLTEILGHVRLIEQVVRSVMKEGEHYGTIPGCGPKPTLRKPGAEKLLMAFRLATRVSTEIVKLDGGHREYRVTTQVVTPEGRILAEGVGSCSTLESKYRWRDQKRSCPECGKEAIIKGKAEYGGGWICFKKQNGCGAKFDDNDPGIVDQPLGRIENPDIADTFNTVWKMAKKRSQVDGTLSATGASDFFTQDIEDLERKEAEEKKKQAKNETAEEFDVGLASMAEKGKNVVVPPPPTTPPPPDPKPAKPETQDEFLASLAWPETMPDWLDLAAKAESVAELTAAWNAFLEQCAQKKWAAQGKEMFRKACADRKGHLVTQGKSA